MAKIVTSARGERVDFDLIGIKSALASIPATKNVKGRERFINKKRRRGLKRKVDEMAQTKRLEDANFDSAVEIQEGAAIGGIDVETEMAAVLGVDPEATQKQRRKVGK